MNIKTGFDILISEIIKKNLCSGCGTCVGVCPTQAIYFVDTNYFPEWNNKNNCSNCGFCVKTCPGKGLKLKKINEESKNREQKFNLDIGNYINFKAGHSKNDLIQRESASGGIATSLLIYALEKKIVDKVIIVTNDKNKIAKPIVKITSDINDVIDSMQSKYIQVPLNTVIKDILNSEYKYGIIGLPCHLEGLYLAENVYKKLSERIVFKIGLFCGYTYCHDCVNTLIKKMNIEKDNIEKFLGWREGDTYPGYFTIKLKNGSKSRLSFIEEHNIDVTFFSLFRCFLCIDGLSHLSDISLGDTTDPHINNTFIISRTETGEKLLKSAKNDNFIDFYDIPDEIAINTGIIPFMLNEKRHKVLSVINYLSRRGIPTPKWDITTPDISIINKINAIMRVKMIMFLRKPTIYNFLLSKPGLMEKIGEFVYQFNINIRVIILIKATKFLKNYPRLFKVVRNIYNKNYDLKFSKKTDTPESYKISRKINASLIGVGGWGHQYVQILKKSQIFDLRVCYDINQEVLSEVCHNQNISKSSSIEELLNYKNIEVVFIATPNHLHFKHIMASLKKGKHVFVEKPVTNTTKEAEKILKYANKKNLSVTVGHNVHRKDEISKMKKIIDSYEIGEIKMVEANISQPLLEIDYKWRLDKRKCPNGPLLQLGIHQIDNLRYLFGEIEEVISYSNDLKSNFNTYKSIILFKSGLLGYLGTSYQTEKKFSFNVLGTNGTITLEKTNLFLEKKGKKRKIKTKNINTLENQINNFGLSLLNNTKLDVDLEYAIINLRIVEAISRSSKLKKAVKVSYNEQ